MSDPHHETLSEVKSYLRDKPVPGGDWYDLLDAVEWMEENGYNGDFDPEPDIRIEDAAFEAGLATGYALAARDGECDE